MFLRLILIFAVLAPAAAAKPLIPSSEETAARLCRAFDDAPERLVALCGQALAEGGLTERERADITARLGDAHDRAGNREASAEAYARALELAPDLVRALNGLGWLAWDSNDSAAAAGFFRKSLAARPTAEALAGLASALRHDGTAKAGEVEELLAAAIAIAPDYPFALREQGWVALDGGSPGPAREAFEAALALDPEDANATYGLSHALEEEDRLEEALEAASRAVALDPVSPWARGQRALILHRLDRNAQAIGDAEAAIEGAPEWSLGYTVRGKALEALGRRAEALDVFAAGVGAGAETNALLYWYADVLSNDSRFAEAAKMIDRALASPGADQHDLSLKAYIAMKLEDHEASIAAADRALKLDPDMAWPEYYAAVGLVMTGRVEEGLARFDAGMAKGLGGDSVGMFVADLIAAGRVAEAIKLRARY